MSDYRRYFDAPYDRDPWGRPRRAPDPYRRDRDHGEVYGVGGEQARRAHEQASDPYARAPAPPAPPPTDERVGELEEQVAILRDQLEQRDQETRTLTVRAHTAETELENAKARIEREAARELEQRKRSILAGMLEVMDDLDRAIAAGRSEAGGSGLLHGVELVRQGFLRRLEQLGVEHDPAAGSAFDPQRHEAVSSVPVADPARRGTVMAVLREGYRIGDSVLRPASVVVGA